LISGDRGALVNIFFCLNKSGLLSKFIFYFVRVKFNSRVCVIGQNKNNV